MNTYEEKKELLCAELRKKSASKQEISLSKDSSNLFRARRQSQRDQKIDVRSFNKVIRIDPQAQIAEVEGMASYADYVEEALKYSCLPAVVPELTSITIGGAIAGCGIESSSFRYGLVHETILEMDVLLSNGSVVTCTPDNQFRDLFYAIPNTFGTLGYVLKVKAQLIPAKKFVELHHQPFSNPQDFFEGIKRICNAKQVDYCEGVIFEENKIYATTGEFVEIAPYASNYKYRNIYYRSIEKLQSDYLTTSDYIWRWDTDWFWCSKVFYMQNPFVRILLGKFLLGSATYNKIMRFANKYPIVTSLHRMGKRKESVIQDVVIPIDNAAKFYEFFRKEIGIKPIWICPTQNYSKQYRYDFCPLDPDKLYVDFGFWDSIDTDHENGFYNRKIERIVQELGGFKSLYSDSYYSEEEFWRLFNRSRYEELKNKYDPERRLKELYGKCVK